MNDFDEFDGEFNELKDVDRLETDRMISLEKVMAKSGKKKFNMLPLIFSSFAVFAVGLFLMMTIKEYTSVVESQKTIIDDQSVPEIPIVEVESNMITVEYGIDNMDKGNHDYETIGTGKRIVVEPGVSRLSTRGRYLFCNTEVFKWKSRFKSSRELYIKSCGLTRREN